MTEHFVLEKKPLGQAVVRIMRGELEKILGLKEGERIINLHADNRGAIEILVESRRLPVIGKRGRPPDYIFEEGVWRS